MRFQEGARGVGAVDLKTLGLAAVLTGQAHIVEHRAHVEQLPVKAQAPPQTGQRSKVIDPA